MVPWLLSFEKAKQTTKSFEKLEKLKFYRKFAETCNIKNVKNYSMANQNLSVTFYQT